MIKQYAFTLLELLLTQILFVLLLSLVFPLIANTKKAYQLQLERLDIIERESLITQLLKEDISKAGWHDNILPSNNSEAVRGIVFTDNKQHTYDGGHYKTSDQLSIEYHADYDCAGKHHQDRLVNNIYSVKDNVLYCNQQPLLHDVEQMQLLFGVDLTGNQNVNQYITANKVLEQGLAKNIVAIRLALLLRSSKLIETVEQQSFVLLNEQRLTFNDRIMRYLVEFTLSCHNINEL